MAAITLQFSAARDLGSLAIREYDRGPWSHVDAVLEDGGLLGARNDICAGIPSGVRIRPKGYFPFEAIKQVIIPTTSEISNAYYDFVKSQLGKGYDQTAIMAFVFQRNWRDEDSWFCSELQGAAAEKSALFPFPLATTSNKLTPNALFLAISAIASVW